MIIIMLGAPGTGKGTVAGILQDKLKIKQISTGDIFRQNIKEESEIGLIAKKYIEQGALVPDEFTNKIVENRINQSDVKNGMILDGYPRNVKQAEKLEEMLKKQDRKIDKVILLTTPEDEIVERVSNRLVCPNCKSVFNTKLNPPKKERNL